MWVIIGFLKIKNKFMYKVIFLENKLCCFVFLLILFINVRNINMYKFIWWNK